VCNYLGLTREELYKKAAISNRFVKEGNRCFGRQIICYLLKRVLYQKIGLRDIAIAAYNNTHHSTVVCTLKSVQDKIDTEKDIRIIINIIASRIEERLLKL